MNAAQTNKIVWGSGVGVVILTAPRLLCYCVFAGLGVQPHNDTRQADVAFKKQKLDNTAVQSSTLTVQ